MIDRQEIIEETTGTDEWDAFSGKVQMLDEKDLAAIADRLGVSVESDAVWQDYRDAFGKEYWREFTLAYEHVMGGTY
jgi:hypothetical protein